MTKEWVSVAQYKKLKNLNSTQVVYNWIATGKLKKDIQWREVEVVVLKKEVLYEI